MIKVQILYPTDFHEYELIDSPMPSDTISQRLDSITNAVMVMGGFPPDSQMADLLGEAIKAATSSIQAKAAELRDLNAAKAKRGSVG